MLNLQILARRIGKSVCWTNFSSSTAAPIAAKFVSKSEAAEESINSSSSTTTKVPLGNVNKSKNPLVAAAFESLLTDDSKTDDIKAPQLPDALDQQILKANTVKGLLAITDGNTSVTRKHALKVVSILAEWSSINRVQLVDFENDPKFIKLCRLLGRAVPKTNDNSVGGGGGPKKITGFRTDDLNTVIGVAGDDEAAKLVASISIPQMIRVLSALAQKKRRSTPLMRSIAYNISSNPNPLDLKQCADLLYAMAVLNFPDSVLISRISIDVQNGLAKNFDRPAAVGSIITSLGLLKFRDADVLESLIDWVLQHHEICRPQDISSMFLTLGTLNYPSTQADKIKSNLVNGLAKEDFSKLSEWLNHVWALVVLNFADAQHYDSVLNNEFIEKLVIERGDDLSPTIKMKLLNINAATKLLQPAYKGSKLNEKSSIFSVPILPSKNKQILINGLLDTLKSLFTSDELLRTNFDTSMGFVIDAECVLDKNRNPLPVAKNHKDAKRFAIMVLDFHDMCQGVHQQPNGCTALAYRLLESNGYTILTVPYNEFNTSDKLLKRVQYIDGKIKRTIINAKV